VTGQRRGPERTLADWTPEDGDQASWLASGEADGWRPEYSGRLRSWWSTAARSPATRWSATGTA